MPSIQRRALPESAFLGKYTRSGAYTDCYVTEIARHVAQAEYVEAFYTTAVFKLERLILTWLVSMPSTDLQAKQLAAGVRESFAAWTVEHRSADQLLLTDFRGHTRSWLMVAPVQDGGRPATRLYFGSAVVPTKDAATGRVTLRSSYRALLGFHKLYSRILLRAARSRLARRALAEQ